MSNKFGSTGLGGGGSQLTPAKSPSARGGFRNTAGHGEYGSRNGDRLPFARLAKDVDLCSPNGVVDDSDGNGTGGFGSSGFFSPHSVFGGKAFYGDETASNEGNTQGIEMESNEGMSQNQVDRPQNNFGDAGFGNLGDFGSNAFSLLSNASGFGNVSISVGGKKGRCFKCGEKGHNKAECPNPKKPKKKGNSSIRAALGNSGGFGGGGAGKALACFFNCGESGHKKSECIEPKKGFRADEGSQSSGNGYNGKKGGQGHTSQNSSEPKNEGGGSGTKNASLGGSSNCDEEGHHTSDCREPKEESTVSSQAAGNESSGDGHDGHSELFQKDQEEHESQEGITAEKHERCDQSQPNYFEEDMLECNGAELSKCILPSAPSNSTEIQANLDNMQLPQRELIFGCLLLFFAIVIYVGINRVYRAM